MSEPRCGLVHMRSGRALAKLASGDCAAALGDFSVSEEGSSRKLRRGPYEFKLQVARADEQKKPELLWIRIGSHPQRCLCVGSDGSVRLEQWLSPAATEPQWRLRILEAQETEQPDGKAFPALVLLQSVHTGLYLCADEEGGKPKLSPEPEPWGLMRLRGAATPGKVLRRSTVAGGLGLATASVATVGIAGAAAVAAGTRVAGAAAGTAGAVSAGAGAVGTAVHAASGLTVAKAAAALAAIPGSAAGLLAAGTATVAAVGTLGATVHYGAVGLGAGAAAGAVGAVGVVTAAMTRLVDSADEQDLYVHGYPFLPPMLSRSVSRLSVGSED